MGGIRSGKLDIPKLTIKEFAALIGMQPARLAKDYVRPMERMLRKLTRRPRYISDL